MLSGHQCYMIRKYVAIAKCIFNILDDFTLNHLYLTRKALHSRLNRSQIRQTSVLKGTKRVSSSFRIELHAQRWTNSYLSHSCPIQQKSTTGQQDNIDYTSSSIRLSTVFCLLIRPLMHGPSNQSRENNNSRAKANQYLKGARSSSPVLALSFLNKLPAASKLVFRGDSLIARHLARSSEAQLLQHALLYKARAATAQLE